MKPEYDFSNGKRGRFFREDTKQRLPTPDEKPDWVGSEGPLAKFIVGEAEKSLGAYRAQPSLVTEHANLEHDTAHGGYAHRQLFELVQNSADALRDAPTGKSILIRLTKKFLYCADDGGPIDKVGIEGLMFARMSSKRNTGAIGRFGLGFKSVLRVTGAPEFYSRPVSFRFDASNAARRIAEIAPAERYPVLRLPEPIDPHEERDTDEELRELMSWATNIVRLPLKSGAYANLAEQIKNFPPEFLLLVDHVRYLTLENGEPAREFTLEDRRGELHLDTGEGLSHWQCFETTHRLSAEARNDWPLHDDSCDVPLRWAVPLDRLDRPGHFWAFFPTKTASLLAGVLNAPWKTNEDRQNLLPGPYNDELIDAAARLIASKLPKLATQADPARHLDALPRERQSGDSEQVDRLRRGLFSNLHGREVIPDQCGKLRVANEIRYPPKKLTVDRQEDAAPFARWAAYPGRPMDWLYHGALTRNRLARIDRLFDLEGEPPRWPASGAVRAEVSEWLEALVEDQKPENILEASKAAIQTAALISSETRSDTQLGDIVFTTGGTLEEPDPDRLFLPTESLNDSSPADPLSCVHANLVSDRETLSALKKLGLKPPSPESRFWLAAKRIFGSGAGQASSEASHREFWIASRPLSDEAALAIIGEHKDWKGRKVWPYKLRVRTRAGNWLLWHSVLLPGDIVPGDGSRDDDATVDTEFHECDVDLLRTLGLTALSQNGRDLSPEPWFPAFLSEWRSDFLKQDLPRNPQRHLLNFLSTAGTGPLNVLTVLSDRGRALCTNALLSLDTAYEPWTMGHDTQEIYGTLRCESPVVHMLRKHGRIKTQAGIVPFADALGQSPESPDALHALLTHPKAEKIKEAFGLAEPVPEFFGEGDPIPLIDIWPGLRKYLPAHREHCRLISCDRILVVGQARACVFRTPDIYLVGAVDDEERDKLELVADELGLGLSPWEIEAILQRRTLAEVEERRAAIRQQCSNDAERLLAAVGEQELRCGLPGRCWRSSRPTAPALTGIEIADAAIATYHTDALRQYKRTLDLLDPPSKWAGSPRAVEFVRSLGFFGRMGRRARQ